jgi:hypothetical protein
MGWVSRGSDDAPAAVTSVSRSFIQARDGHASLKLAVKLTGDESEGSTYGGRQNYRQGEVIVDMRYSWPSGIVTPAPYDLTGTTITCWIYAPAGSAGATDTPNSLQIFVRDANFGREEGTPVEITSEREGTWFPITLAFGTQESNTHSDIDPTRIIVLGVKISGDQKSTYLRYEGPILIDACDW